MIDRKGFGQISRQSLNAGRLLHRQFVDDENRRNTLPRFAGSLDAGLNTDCGIAVHHSPIDYGEHVPGDGAMLWASRQEQNAAAQRRLWRQSGANTAQTRDYWRVLALKPHPRLFRRDHSTINSPPFHEQGLSFEQSAGALRNFE